jgi:hypothetical protein
VAALWVTFEKTCEIQSEFQVGLNLTDNARLRIHKNWAGLWDQIPCKAFETETHLDNI